MKGIDLLGYLSAQKDETLQQEVLFNIKVLLNHEGSKLDGPVRAEGVIIATTDQFLTPNGIMHRTEAEEQYMEAQIYAALGEATEEDVQEVALPSCPLLMAKNQMLIVLESVDARPPTADIVFGPPEGVDGPLEYWLTASQFRFIHRVLKEWQIMKGQNLTEKDKVERDSLKDALNVHE